MDPKIPGLQLNASKNILNLKASRGENMELKQSEEEHKALSISQ